MIFAKAIAHIFTYVASATLIIQLHDKNKISVATVFFVGFLAGMLIQAFVWK